MTRLFLYEDSLSLLPFVRFQRRPVVHTKVTCLEIFSTQIIMGFHLMVPFRTLMRELMPSIVLPPRSSLISFYPLEVLNTSTMVCKNATFYLTVSVLITHWYSSSKNTSRIPWGVVHTEFVSSLYMASQKRRPKAEMPTAPLNLVLSLAIVNRFTPVQCSGWTTSIQSFHLFHVPNADAMQSWL
jgi:hypothetical protein